MNDFGALLKRHRERQGWGAAAVASRAGVDASHVTRLEHGARMPTRDMVQRLAAALGLAPIDAAHLSVAAGFVPATGVVVLVDGALVSFTLPLVEARVVAWREPAAPVCQVCRDYARPVVARSRCQRCYQAYRRRAGRRREIVCTSCGEQRDHAAGGLCERCYKRRQREALERAG